MPPTTDDLIEVDDELWRALLHADAGAALALIDPEAHLEHPPLPAGGGDDLASALATGALRFTQAEILQRRARITGELATTVAIVNTAGTHEGAPFRARLRWVRTWRLGSAWVLVAVSAAPPREQGRQMPRA